MNDFYNKSFSQIGNIDLEAELKTDSKLFFLGSCFSDNLYNRLKNFYLDVFNSPFGNVYNPISISNSINRLILDKKIKEDEVFYVNNLYQHFDFHSRIGNRDKESFINTTNNLIEDGHRALKESDILIITLGTSYVYKKDNKVVNNCHKLDKNLFIREPLTLNEITSNLKESFKALFDINPGINIILTLSPVRHLRDSFTENSYSKALLRVAIEELIKEKNVEYFPSYEIMLDELRDYRWYNRDLSHPSELAVEYITDNFLNSAGDRKFLSYLPRAIKINKMFSHKIINSESSQSLEFIKKRDSRVLNLIKEFPEVKGLKKLR